MRLDRYQALAVAIRCLVLALGLITTSEALARSVLLFEHQGPEDASIPPFRIFAGKCERESLTRIRVSDEVFGDLVTLLADAERSMNDRRHSPGTFLVTVSTNGEPDSHHLVPRETMLLVIARVRSAFAAVDAPMPSILVKVETQLRAGQ